MIQDKGIIERRQLKRMAADEFRMYMFSFPKEDEYEVLNLLLMSNAQIMLIDINTPEELQKIDIKEVSCTKRTVMAVLRRLVRDDSEVFKPLKEVCVYAAIALPNNNNDDMLYKNYLYLRLKNVFKSFHVYAYSVYCNRVVLRMRSNVQSGILMESGKQHCTSVNALNYVVMPFLGLGDFFMQFSCIYEFARTRPNHVYLAEVRRNGDKRLLYYSDVVKYLSFSCGNQFLDFEKIASNIKTISLFEIFYRLTRKGAIFNSRKCHVTDVIKYVLELQPQFDPYKYADLLAERLNAALPIRERRYIESVVGNHESIGFQYFSGEYYNEEKAWGTLLCKNWSVENAEEFVRACNHAGIKIIILNPCPKLKAPVVALNGLSLPGYAYAISKLKMLVGIDSSAGHIAAFYNIPSITIWGGQTPFEVWEAKVSFRPMRKNFSLYSLSLDANKVSPDKVIKSIKQLNELIDMQCDDFSRSILVDE